MAAPMDWRLSSVEELIRVWEDCPCLWDTRLKSYKDKNLKKAAFKELADKFETTADEVSKKLKNLRSQFLREKNKLKEAVKSGMGTDDLPKCTWVHFDALHFLADSVATRPSRSNISSQVSQDEDGDANDYFDEQDHDLPEDDIDHDSEGMPEITKSTKKPLTGKRISKKRKLEERENNLLERAAVAIEKATMDEQENVPSTNVDDVFGQYIAAELKTVTEERTKRLIKHRIQNVIFECTVSQPHMQVPNYIIPPQPAAPVRNFSVSQGNPRNFGTIPSSHQETFQSLSMPSPCVSPSTSTSCDSQMTYMNL